MWSLPFPSQEMCRWFFRTRVYSYLEMMAYKKQNYSKNVEDPVILRIIQNARPQKFHLRITRCLLLSKQYTLLNYFLTLIIIVKRNGFLGWWRKKGNNKRIIIMLINKTKFLQFLMTGCYKTPENYLRSKGVTVGLGCSIAPCRLSAKEGYLIKIGNYCRIARNNVFFTHGGLYSLR